MTPTIENRSFDEPVGNASCVKSICDKHMEQWHNDYIDI